MSFIIGDRVKTRQAVPGIETTRTPIGSTGTVTGIENALTKPVYRVTFDKGSTFGCWEETIELVQHALSVPSVWHPGAKTKRKLVL